MGITLPASDYVARASSESKGQIVELVSPRTAARDRGTKVEWYRRYGVAEAWLVDVKRCSVEVIELRSTPEHRTLFTRDTPIQSGVLVRWNATPAEVLS